MWLYIIIAVVVVLLLLVFTTYNSFVKLNNKVEEAFSTMDVYLKKRWDLIPNIVETVKGYAKHESETLEKVIAARTAYLSSNGSVEAAQQAENALNSSLKSIFALSESYPELKANASFQNLQIELTGTEDKIAFARQFYNDTVQSYNRSLMVFPNNIVAGMFGQFTAKPFFEIEEEAKQNVKVSF